MIREVIKEVINQVVRRMLRLSEGLSCGQRGDQGGDQMVTWVTEEEIRWSEQRSVVRGMIRGQSDE